MKTVTASEFRSNLSVLLDEVLATGVPLEIQIGDNRVRVVAVEPVDILQNLVERPDFIRGDPETLVSIHWKEDGSCYHE